MKKQSSQQRQVNQYDKIFKENIEAVIPSLMEKVLGIIAVEQEELPDDIQHTKERKPDVLKKIIDDKGRTFVFQLEFQVADEPDMVYRMADYHLMLARKYRLPVEQFVIFLGSSKPTMAASLQTNRLTFSFPIVSFAELDYLIFLKSDKPEEIVLGILANFDPQPPHKAIEQLLKRVQETTAGELTFNRYVNQLRILAQLRNRQPLLNDAMLTISQFFNEEDDVLFKRGERLGEQRGELRGEQRGEQKTKEQIVKNLLIKTSMTHQQIAETAEVSVEFVERIVRTIN